MTPSRRCTVALTVAAALLFTVPAFAAPADAGDSPAFGRLATLWSQLWTGIDRFFPGGDAGPTVEIVSEGSGALLNPDGSNMAPSGGGDESGALLNPDGQKSNARGNGG